MTVFTDAAQFTTVMQALFTRMETEDPHAADGLLKAKLCVQLRCSSPVAVMIFDGGKRPLSITYSANGSKPDLDVEVTCDALHQILSARAWQAFWLFQFPGSSFFASLEVSTLFPANQIAMNIVHGMTFRCCGNACLITAIEFIHDLLAFCISSRCIEPAQKCGF